MPNYATGPIPVQTSFWALFAMTLFRALLTAAGSMLVTKGIVTQEVAKGFVDQYGEQIAGGALVALSLSIGAVRARILAAKNAAIDERTPDHTVVSVARASA